MEHTVSKDREDFSPLGILISVCLVLLLCAQISSVNVIIFDPSSPKHHDSSMWVGLIALFSIILWLPGFIIGYKILKKLRNKLVGSMTLTLSFIEFIIFIWALAN